VEAKIFKANVNSRDLKGWSCVAIAVFHDSLRVLALLLEHAADPSLRSSYNKSAWDLAKDELDAAEKVIRSKAASRQVLVDWDRERQRTGLFGKGSLISASNKEGGTGIDYSELGEDGGAMVMNIELNQEMARGADDNKDKDNKKAKGSGKASSSGGGVGKGNNKKGASSGNSGSKAKK